MSVKDVTDPDLAAVVTHSGGSYPVLVGWGLLNRLGSRLATLGVGGPVYMISDERVFPIHGRRAQLSLEGSKIEAHCYVVPAGEQSKSLEMAGEIYRWLADRRAERGHAVIAVGGGVVGDLAGFVASTYLRGMPFVQVPTSMAAMVDASIGGKVAVNLPEGKNLVGAFHQPRLVLSDISSLETLGKRERAEGWAEAIKHGLILDAELFSTFEEHSDALLALSADESSPEPNSRIAIPEDGGERQLWARVIRHSAAIKAQIVSEDERETLGRRVLLNYGHTIGHGLEAAAGYGQYLHGEAVSVGMMGAAMIAQHLGMIDEGVMERHRRLLERFGLPTSAPDVDPERLSDAMSLDKKTEGGSIKWVLLEGVGQAVTRRDVPSGLVHETLETLCRPQRQVS